MRHNGFVKDVLQDSCFVDIRMKSIIGSMPCDGSQGAIIILVRCLCCYAEAMKAFIRIAGETRYRRLHKTIVLLTSIDTSLCATSQEGFIVYSWPSLSRISSHTRQNRRSAAKQNRNQHHTILDKDQPVTNKSNQDKMSHPSWYTQNPSIIPGVLSTSDDSDTNTNTVITTPPAAVITPARTKTTKATSNVLYDVICCKCKRILNLQSIHYSFQCCHCRHRRCDNCTTEKVPGT